MHGSVVLPFIPDAVAVCGPEKIALFDADARRITQWMFTEKSELVEAVSMLPKIKNEKVETSRNPWCSWKMALKAPVVVSLNLTGNMGVLTQEGYKEYPKISAHRIVQVDAEGKWTLLQSRQDILQIDLTNGNILQNMRLTSAAFIGKKGTTASISGGKLSIEKRDLTKKQITLTASTWVPINIHVGDEDTIFIQNVSKKNKEYFVQIQEWTPDLKCIKTLTFEDPFFEFSTVGKQERWCCHWPKRGGFVVQNADGHGNSITCRYPPVAVGDFIVYSTDQDRKRIIFQS